MNGDATVVAIRPCPASAREGRLGDRTVISSIQRFAPDIWTLTLAGDKAPIEVTGSHAVYCLSRDAWTMAKNLKPGDTMLSAAGDAVAVVDMVPRGGTEPVWNLEVHRGHSYFVGEASVLVHNHPPIDPDSIELHHLLPQSKDLKQKFKDAGLDIEDYKIPLTAADHRLSPGGVHTNAGGNWNKKWKEFFDGKPDASKKAILAQKDKMRKDFGI